MRYIRKEMHKGVEYSIAPSEPGLWTWCFQIGETVTTGAIRTNLAGMAAHTARQRINRALKSAPEPFGTRLIVADQSAE